MMLCCSRFETNAILEGRAQVLTRVYDPKMGCPHRPGDKVTLTSPYVVPQQERELPFAVATVISVRPCTAREIRTGSVGVIEGGARQDGFPNGEACWAHMGIMYPGIQEDAPVFRIQVRIDELEKDMAARMERVGMQS